MCAFVTLNKKITYLLTYLNEDVENALVGRLLLAEYLHVERRNTKSGVRRPMRPR